MPKRERYSIVTQPIGGVITTRAATIENGPQGSRVVLPLKGTHSAVSGGSMFGTHEIIEDDVGPKGAMKGCLHTKRTIKSPDDIALVDSLMQSIGPVRGSYSSNSYAYYDRIYTRSLDAHNEMVNWAQQRLSPPSFVSAPHTSFVPMGAPTGDRTSELIPRIMNAIGGFQGANALYELKEMPMLLSMLRGRRGLIEGSKSVLNTLRKKGIVDIKGFIAAYRSGYLGTNFGLLPTLSDLQALAREIRNPSTRKRVRSRSVTVSDTWSQPASISEALSATGRCRSRRAELIKNQFRVFGARITPVRLNTEYGSFEGLANFIDRFIGMNPASIIWNAVPFTWAVDYFASLDNVLDSLWLNNQDRFKIEYWSSIKTEATFEVRAEYLEERIWLPRQAASPTYYSPDEYRYKELTHRASYKMYSRQPKAAPGPLDSLKSRLTPQKVFTTFLVASGFIKSMR